MSTQVIKTIKVKPWHATQGEFVLINEEDFDPEFHENLEEPKKPAPAKAK